MKARTALLFACLLLVGAACSRNPSTTYPSTSPAASSTPAASSASSSAMVQTKTVGSLGSVLVDARGRTLYHFDRDKAGAIACVGACTTTWPPLTISASGTVPTTPAGLSSVSRPGGSKQIAYQGKPLYTYSGDTKPGDANGDGFAGLWHAAKVSG